MRLKLERGDAAQRTGNEYGVFDETTGKCVGTVSFDKVPRVGEKSYPSRTIRLFDSKYVGIFNTHMECVAFVKGVEVVLHAEGEGREEVQVASEPHARDQGEAGWTGRVDPG
jgi:hypothetical protein